MAERIGIRTPDDGAAAFHERVEGWLDDHAAETGRAFDQVPFAFEAHVGDEPAGGIGGRVMWGWTEVRFLAVLPRHRGRGVGRALMQAAEAHARSEGCIGLYLDTYGFQAPGFYPRLGYVEIGRLPGREPAQTRRWFAKRFDGGPVS